MALLAAAAAAAAAAISGGTGSGSGSLLVCGGVIARPTRRNCPPKSKRFMAATASLAESSVSYSINPYLEETLLGQVEQQLAAEWYYVSISASVSVSILV